MARERAVDRWLHEQVGPVYGAMKADPSRAVSLEKVRVRIAAEHNRLSSNAE